MLTISIQALNELTFLIHLSEYLSVDCKISVPFYNSYLLQKNYSDAQQTSGVAVCNL